jgi:hypothetical protein
LIGGPKNLDAKNLVAYINGAENRNAENRGTENLIAAYTGCWSLNQTDEHTARFGNTLFTYWQTTKVCAINGRVSSVAVTYADGETNTPGWRIKSPPEKSAKSVGWEGRGLAKFFFVFGTNGFDLQHSSPCIQQRLNANGHDHQSMRTCNLDAR